MGENAEKSWECPRCRNLNEAGQATCWFCGWSRAAGELFIGPAHSSGAWSLVRAFLLSVGVLLLLGFSVVIAFYTLCSLLSA
jgi:hypothetical protein